MQYGKSFFNIGIFHRDLKKLIPLIVIFCLLMVSVGRSGNVPMWDSAALESTNYGQSLLRTDVFDSIFFIGIIANFFAILTGVVLFSYLYKSRLVNGMHAMPMRREGWFLTHFCAGLTAGIVPIFLFPVLLMNWIFRMPMLALQWYLVMGSCYLAFYCVAVFCCVSAGRMSGAVLGYYGVLFAPGLLSIPVSFIAYLTMPTVYGISNSMWDFCIFSDLRTMYMLANLYQYDQGFNLPTILVRYTVYFLAIALVTMIGAWLVYRRRKNESAGDFLSVTWLKPVYSALIVSAVSYVLFQLLYAVTDQGVVSLIVAFAVAFLISELFIQHSVRIFRKEMFVRLALLALVFACVYAGFALNSDCVEKRTFTREEITGVDVMTSGEYGFFSGTFTNEEAIELHKLILEHPEEYADLSIGESLGSSLFSSSQYQILMMFSTQSGRSVARRYTIDPDAVFSRGIIQSYLYEIGADEDKILPKIDEDSYSYVAKRIVFSDPAVTDETLELSTEQTEALIHAIEEDIKEKKISVLGSVKTDADFCSFLFTRVQKDDPDLEKGYYCIYIKRDCTYVMQWLSENCPEVMEGLS